MDKTLETAQDMLTVCIKCSPNRDVQTAFADFYNLLKREGESEANIIKALCFRLIDGLQYDNWPE